MFPIICIIQLNLSVMHFKSKVCFNDLYYIIIYYNNEQFKILKNEIKKITNLFLKLKTLYEIISINFFQFFSVSLSHVHVYNLFSNLYTYIHTQANNDYFHIIFFYTHSSSEKINNRCAN